MGKDYEDAVEVERRQEEQGIAGCRDWRLSVTVLQVGAKGSGSICRKRKRRSLSVQEREPAAKDVANNSDHAKRSVGVALRTLSSVISE